MMEKNKAVNLMIVDDESESLNPLCDILSQCGYVVTGFTSGREALEVLRQRSFDLLLTDLVMPEMDGIDLLRAAVEVDPLIVGIIITGKGTIQTAVEAMKAGAFDYVLKPLDMAMLKQILARALEVRRLREAEKKYRSIFENALGGIYQTTPEGHCITANSALAGILGYESPEELIANIRDMGQLYVEHDRRSEFIRLMQENSIVTGFESQVYRKDGSTIWISENAHAVYHENGKLLYYEGIVEDITKRRKAEEELKRSREQLRNLSGHLQTAIEDERKYIAREIHDELGQILTALKMDLFWLNCKIPREKKMLISKTRFMCEMIDTAVKTIQRISSEIRPGILDDLGLSSAIEWYAVDFQKRTGIKCELFLYAEETALRQDVSIAIYRIFQEALTNVARHARAERLKIKLHEQADNIILEVTDNGIGITEEQIFNPKSFGLTGIQERVHLLGGEAKIIGVPNSGTTVHVNIPLYRDTS
jgi:two-component system sensor histidine kinase UhpB